MRFRLNINRLFLIWSFLLAVALPGKSQTNMVFYPLEEQINSSGMNPSFLTKQNRFTFSIFPLSGLNVGYNNQQAVKNMLTDFVQGDQTNEQFREVFDSMISLELFYQRLEDNLLSFGYNSSVGSFDFRIKENIQLLTDVKNKFSEFLINNTAQSIALGTPESFPALALHYREYSLGYAKEIIRNKLSVGVRLKAYFGKAAMESSASGVAVQKNSDIYLQTNGRLNISAPIDVVSYSDNSLQTVALDDNLSAGNYLMNSKNSGFGFDLGFNYQLTPELSFSGSVIDVGKINWKNNLNNMNFEGEYKLPAEFIVANTDGVLTKNPDFTSETVSFPELYKIKTDALPYTTQMPMTVYAGIKYRLSTRFNMSLINRFIHAPSMSFNSIMASGIYDLKANLSLIAGFSVLGNSYVNIPFALLYRWGGGQVYAGTDNLLSVLIPSVSEFSGITFGMCFYPFKEKMRYNDQIDYLPFYREKKHKGGRDK